MAPAKSSMVSLSRTAEDAFVKLLDHAWVRGILAQRLQAFLDQFRDDERRFGANARLNSNLVGEGEGIPQHPGRAVEYLIAGLGRGRGRHEAKHDFGSEIIPLEQCRAAARVIAGLLGDPAFIRPAVFQCQGVR